MKKYFTIENLEKAIVVFLIVVSLAGIYAISVCDTTPVHIVAYSDYQPTTTPELTKETN